MLANVLWVARPSVRFLAVAARRGERLEVNGYALGVVELASFERRLSLLFPSKAMRSPKAKAPP